VVNDTPVSGFLIISFQLNLRTAAPPGTMLLFAPSFRAEHPALLPWREAPAHAVEEISLQFLSCQT
jgi:hypothetical protein